MDPVSRKRVFAKIGEIAKHYLKQVSKLVTDLIDPTNFFIFVKNACDATMR